MFWGQTRSLLLLTIIHGVCCSGTFEPTCSTGSCSCGESVTITCTVAENLDTITLRNNKNVTLFEYDFGKKKTQATKDGKFSITYTEENTPVTIYIYICNVQLSDKDIYTLFLNSVSTGFKHEYMDLNISGICEPKIYKTEEAIECEAEGIKSNLKGSTTVGNNPGETGKDSSIAAIVILIVLIVAALGYLIKKWNKNIISGIFKNMNCAPLVRRLSQAPLMGQEEPEEENTTMQPLPPTQTV